MPVSPSEGGSASLPVSPGEGDVASVPVNPREEHMRRWCLSVLVNEI